MEKNTHNIYRYFGKNLELVANTTNISVLNTLHKRTTPAARNIYCGQYVIIFGQ